VSLMFAGGFTSGGELLQRHRGSRLWFRHTSGQIMSIERSSYFLEPVSLLSRKFPDDTIMENYQADLELVIPRGGKYRALLVQCHILRSECRMD
jgi:hypothetical protein